MALECSYYYIVGVVSQGSPGRCVMQRAHHSTDDSQGTTLHLGIVLVYN